MNLAALARQRLPTGARCSVAVASRDGAVTGHDDCPGQSLPIYSVTKTFIATLVLRTVAAGRLALDDEAFKWHPDVPRRVTVRMLLNHTAGLPDYGPLPDYRAAVAGAGPPWDDAQFAGRTYRRGLLFVPGTGWAYANAGYALLVRLLETLHGAPFAELVAQQVTRPLDLHRTRAVDTLAAPDIVPSRSTLWPGVAVAVRYDPGWVWHHLLVSTGADLVRFLAALFTGALLPPALLAAMTELVAVPERHPLWSAPAYGLGLMAERAGARGPVYGHNGDGPGYCASAYYFPERRVAAAALATCEDSNLTQALTQDLHDHCGR